jgi:adenylate cyclase
MPFAEPDPTKLLSNGRLRQAIAVRDWLLGEARTIRDPNIILEGLALRLRDAGMPVERSISAIELRHAERAANARIWEWGKRAREHVYAHERGSEATGKRPLAEAHRLDDWVITWLPETPDDKYDMVPELKAAGFTHHVAVPVLLLNGMRNGFTFATRAPQGFSDEDIALLRVVFPSLAALMEILALHRVMREVLRMYVGDEPHQRILSGEVRRGEVLRVRAAILFADMRNFTGLTSAMTEEEATAFVNEYYDCVVPPIDERGGEVLKFIGDGILAIFRAEEDADNDVEASWRAFAAARAGLERVERRKTKGDGVVPFDVGIALHFGHPAYGNVGSGARLDYTVIGRDVNLAARIASLCGQIGEPLLLSNTFQVRLATAELRSLGAFSLKGLDGEQSVYAPARAAAA